MRQHNVTITATVTFQTVVWDYKGAEKRRQEVEDEAKDLFAEESDHSLDGDRQWSIQKVEKIETEIVEVPDAG